MNTNNIKYLYALVDPKDGQYKYIGITSNTEDRYHTHMIDPQSKPKANWIDSLKNENLSPQLKVLAILEKNVAFETEKKAVHIYKSKYNYVNRENKIETNFLHIRLPVELRIQLELQAKQKERTLSNFVRIILENYLSTIMEARHE